MNIRIQVLLFSVVAAWAASTSAAAAAAAAAMESSSSSISSISSSSSSSSSSNNSSSSRNSPSHPYCVETPDYLGLVCHDLQTDSSSSTTKVVWVGRVCLESALDEDTLAATVRATFDIDPSFTLRASEIWIGTNEQLQDLHEEATTNIGSDDRAIDLELSLWQVANSHIKRAKATINSQQQEFVFDSGAIDYQCPSCHSQEFQVVASAVVSNSYQYFSHSDSDIDLLPVSATHDSIEGAEFRDDESIDWFSWMAHSALPDTVDQSAASSSDGTMTPSTPSNSSNLHIKGRFSIRLTCDCPSAPDRLYPEEEERQSHRTL